MSQNIIAIVVPLVLLLIGGVICIVCCFMAYAKHRRVKLLADTPLSMVEDLEPGIGKTNGEAVALEDPLVSPMTKTECLFFDFRVEEERTRTVRDTDAHGRTRTRTERYWETIVHDRQCVRTAVEDETGQAEVNLEEAEIVLKSAARTQSGTFNSPPASLEKTLRARYGTSTKGLLFNRKLRYTEALITEGDELIVLGEVLKRKKSKRVLFVKGDETPLLVSDKSDEELVSHYRWARNGYIAGAVVAPVVTFIIGIIVLVTVWK
jgi:hypothetical protein